MLLNEKHKSKHNNRNSYREYCYLCSRIYGDGIVLISRATITAINDNDFQPLCEHMKEKKYVFQSLGQKLWPTFSGAAQQHMMVCHIGSLNVRRVFSTVMHHRFIHLLYAYHVNLYRKIQNKYGLKRKMDNFLEKNRKITRKQP